MNFCAKNPPHRQAEKRSGKPQRAEDSFAFTADKL
jgi:hypothetical protein